MVNYCLVPGCSIRTRKGQAVSFHHLPVRDVERCKQWLRAINHPKFGEDTEKEALKTQRVCRLHFKPEDFEPNILGMKRVALKDTAIPSIFTLPNDDKQPGPSGNKRIRLESPCPSTTGGLNNSGASIEVCVPNERDQPKSAITPTPSSLSSEDEGVKGGREKKIIVNESSLMSLFKFCQMCRKPCLSKTIFDSGAHRTVKWTCLGGHSGSWTTSPDVRGRPEGTEGSLCRVLPLHVKHVASQTDPPKRRNTGTQSRVSKRDCGMCTLTFPLDSPILFLQPTLVKRPSKRPRRSLTDKEEGPSQCCLSMEVNTGVQSDSVAI